MKIFKLLMAALFIGCASKQGYLGPIIPDEQLATIISNERYFTFEKNRYHERVLIEKIDTITVGKFPKPNPSKVSVLPGVTNVIFLHYKSWEHEIIYRKSQASGLLEMALYEAFAKDPKYPKMYLAIFNTENNKKYEMVSITDSLNLIGTQFYIEDVGSKKVIDSKIIEIIDSTQIEIYLKKK